MITTITPMLLDGAAANAAAHMSTVAAPLWDIGANLKDKGISFAVFALMGGTAVVAAFEYFVARNKTGALKTLAIGVVLIGLIGSLPALGSASKDSVGGITNGTR